MKRDYFLYDAGGEGKLVELELPIRVGGTNQTGIVIPGIADDQLIAIIALADGHAYIQPADSARTIFHNDERLTDSAWLKSGDRVQIADSIVAWEVLGDRVLISVHAHRLDTVQPRPPQKAPPTPPNDSLPVPEKDPVQNGRKRLRRSVIAFVSVLALIAIYLLTVTSVVIRVEPGVADVSMSGFPPAVPFGGSYLAFPGQYRLNINSPGYVTLTAELDINMGPPVNLTYVLDELPGLISITTDPPVDLNLFVDETEIPANAGGKYEIRRGKHSLRVESSRYLPQLLEVEVEGYATEQAFELELEPAWAVVSISSTPQDAEVLVDSSAIGFTPIHAEILQGQHEIRLQKPGFKPVILFRSVAVGLDFSLGEIQLQPVDGKLIVNSVPAAASILIDGKFLGVTPQTLELAAEMEHKLSLSKTGYKTAGQGFLLAPDEEQLIAVQLEPEYGTVFLKLQPAGATLAINGKKSTQGSGRLRLQTRKNTLLFSKPGYVSQQVMVTPQAGVSQNLDISLVIEQQQRVQQQEAATPQLLTTSIGQTLELVKADGSFQMGASRRDAGRRANESQRLVELQRSFYLAQKEVTNADFRRFNPKHDSGSVDFAALNGELQPVVNVSWDDAARYCNWLSKQQGLPMAYREEGGIMLAVGPMTTGYRLPTEAEWAWVARRLGFEREQRYPWQGGFPPISKDGNYADARIADTLADIVPNYDDGYRGTAPVGSFPAWPQGSSGNFYDMGGNVAEWMHDIYALYPGESRQLVTDPVGPVSGKHHVIRGASWRHGSITELRLSYRDYSSKPRYDLGFRIARYAE